MKKRNFIVVLMAASLGLGSCNDIQELNVEGGQITYTNDYRELVNAINDLSKNLTDRFNALNDALASGFANIKVAIDSNTGAITVLSQETQEGFGTINTSLLEGFKAVKTSIDNLGNQIVDAIDANGNLLRLQIDQTGKLIQTQLITNGQDLINAMKLYTGTLADKMGLIESAIKNGLASTVDSQKATTAAIQALMDEVKAGNKSQENAMKELTDAIKDLKFSLDGKFELINSALEAGFTKLADAEAQMKQAIEVSGENTATRLAALIAAIDSQTTSLAAKLAAIEAANKAGLADVAKQQELLNKAIAALQAELKGASDANAKALEALKTAMESQLASLTTKLGAINISINNGFANTVIAQEATTAAIQALKDQVQAGTVTLDNALGQIKAAIADAGTTLAGKLELINATQVTGFADLKTAMADMKAAIEAAGKSNAEQLAALKEAVNSLQLSLEAKLAAIEVAVEDVAAKNKLIQEAIASLEAEVKAGNISNEEAITAFKNSMASDFIRLIAKLGVIDASINAGFTNSVNAQDLTTAAILALKDKVNEGIISNAQALAEVKAAIDDVDATLSQKLALIDASLQTGFYNEEAALNALKIALENAGKSNADKLDALNTAMTSKLTDLSAKLLLIEAANKAGFASVKDANLLIKLAIEALRAEVETGNMTNAEALKTIKEAIITQTSSLTTKLGALELIIKDGLISVKDGEDLIEAAINELKNQVEEGAKTNAEAINEVTTAIKDADANIQTKFDLLKEAVEAGFIKNETAITLLNEMLNDPNSALADKLGTINGSLISGFYDIDKALDMMRMVIFLSGKDQAARLDSLTEAVKSINIDLKTKLAAIETAITNGFVNELQVEVLIQAALDDLVTALKAGNEASANALGAIKAAIDAQTASLELKLKFLESLEATLDTDLKGIISQAELIKNAVDALKKAVDDGVTTEAAALAQIKEAISGNSDASLSSKLTVIKAALEAGFLSNKNAIDDVKSAIANANTTLETKLAAIEQAVTTGLANSKDKYDLIVKAINDLKTGNDKWLEAIEEAIKAQTTTFDTQFQLVVAAIEAQANDIKTAIGSAAGTIDGGLEGIENKLEALNSSLSSALGDIGTNTGNAVDKLAAIVDAIDFYQELAAILAVEVPCMDEDLHKMIEVLKTLAEDSGIVIPEDDTKSAYVTPSVWDEIKNNSTSPLAKNIKDVLDLYEAPIVAVQEAYSSTTSSQFTAHNHAVFGEDEGSRKDSILVGEEVLFNGKDYVRVRKIVGDISYNVIIDNIVDHGGQCDYRVIFKLKISDAESQLMNDVTNEKFWYDEGKGFTTYPQSWKIRPYRSNEVGSGLPSTKGGKVTNIKLHTYFEKDGKSAIVDSIFLKVCSTK
ncbi:MAG: hypothetical protein MJY59_00310 [Bacteroidaceae bacterium]|nr:hypothetical protein [Bacteroidaceae bacterium]